MYIEYKDMENIMIKPSDEEMALPPEEFFFEISSAVVGIVWELARYITDDEKKLACIVRDFSDSLHHLISITASKYEEEQESSERKTGVGKELYSAMEEWFDDFVERGHYDEKALINETSKMTNPRLCTSIRDGRYCFDICSDNKKTIHVGSVAVDADKQRIEIERVQSSAIAVVLFDKAFEDEEKNPMRGENSQMFFEL